MQLPKSVKLVEVGPRDGLQNEAATIETAIKIELIDRLSQTGLTLIEAGSFVSPKWVPQMADTAEVFARMKRQVGIRYAALVPNLIGFKAAAGARADEIAVVTAASETFARRNVNGSIAETLERIAEICAAAKTQSIPVRGYISCALWCPFEGRIDAKTVAEIAEILSRLGCYEISLGETIGKGTPVEVEQLIDMVAVRIPIEHIAVHFHDTYGQALANVLAALAKGVAVVDASVAGLGGCPYAPGAGGNLASEDVLYMLNGLGIETGVDLATLSDAGRFISKCLGRAPASKVNVALAGV